MMPSDICRVHLVGGWREWPAGWLDGTYWLIRLGRPGSRLPLWASVAGLGGAYRGGCPPSACLLMINLSLIFSKSANNF